jgi:hypothetical protein
MPAVETARQPSWNPDQTFAPASNEVNMRDERRPSNTDQKPGISIRQIRESMTINPDRLQPTAPLPKNSLNPPPTKKKQSLFGGLFATKEPTQLALNQVAAQLVAQHGSTSPTRVPNVRMEKMPEHVPKVNSKWDGVPEVVKEREKKEKDRQRALKRQSMMSTTSRARSVESSERRGRYQQSEGSSARDLSIGSRPKSTTSRKSDPRAPNPHRFYAQSVNSSGDLASQQRSEDGPDASARPSRSLRSPSVSSVPDVTVAITAPPPAVPEIYRSNMKKTVAESSGSSRASKISQAASSEGRASVAEVVPEHTRSPVATPREGSPVTPSTQHAREHYTNVRSSMISNPDTVALESTGPNVLGLPVASKKKLMKQRSEAFLAGEARPFELPDEDDEPVLVQNDLPLRQWGGIRQSFLGKKAPELPSRSIDRVAQDLTERPDSSRSRLGLKPRMVVRTEATPWDGQNDTALGPRSANARSRAEPLSPKRLLPSLGSIRKKES